MTYAEWRKFGYVSNIGRICCGGPSQSTMNTQNALTQQQINNSNAELQLEQNQAALSQQQYNQSQALQQPYIQQQQALASGNPAAVLSASMPTVSNLSGGYNASIEAIKNQTPPGAAQDALIAQANMQKDVGIGTTMANLTQQAPANLAAVGSQSAALSIQELGAALSGFSGAGSALGGASSSNQALGQMQTAASQAFWQPLLGLAGIAGNIATGGLAGSGGFGSIFSSAPKSSSGGGVFGGPLYNSGG